METEIIYLDKGSDAPFGGWLLTGRALAILYEDALKEEQEEVLDQLKDKYNIER